MYRPKVRRDGLLISELQHEIVIYEQQNQKAHYLNPTTSRVWQLADGTREAAEIARILQRELNTPSATAIVELALEQLSRRGLLEETVPASSPEHRRSRRDILKKVAVGLIALPIIVSASTQPAWAQLTPGGSCMTDADCAHLATGGCRTARCVNGQCQTENQPDGTVVSSVGPCSDVVCQGGLGVPQNKEDGTPCTAGDLSGICQGGQCVEGSIG